MNLTQPVLMRRVDLRAIEHVAPLRPPGYKEAILAAGKVERGIVVLSDQDYQRIRQEFPAIQSDDSQVKKGPSLPEKIANLAKSSVKIARSGFQMVSPEERARRKAICLACDQWDQKGNLGAGQCVKCGCTLAKTPWAAMDCKLHRWDTMSIRCYLDGWTGISLMGLKTAEHIAGCRVLAIAGAEQNDALVPSGAKRKVSRDPIGPVVLAAQLEHKDVERRDVIWTMWESDRLPEGQADRLNAENAIAVPSHWNREVFMRSGVQRPIHVVPLGVDPLEFRRMKMPPAKPFVFLAGGRMAHGGKRKGLQEVVDAFRKLFVYSPDVRLRIKGDDSTDLDTGNDFRIEIIRERLTVRQMADWFASGHVLVSSARGEGWGLFQHQAMCVGRPVISVCWGGLTEFFDESVGWVVRHELSAADGVYAGSQWAEPDADSLMYAMRDAVEHYEQVVLKGNAAAARARQFTWSHTAERLQDVSKVAARRVKRPEKTFYHAGDIGDVIYSLPTIKALGGGVLCLGTKVDLPVGLAPRNGITRKVFDALAPLLRAQHYVWDVQWVDDVPAVDYDLNRFRLYWRHKTHDFLERVWRRNGWVCDYSLMWMHLAEFGVTECDEVVPWLSVRPRNYADVIVHRSARYQNLDFPWARVLEKYGLRAVFVGLKPEHDAFEDRFGVVRFLEVENLAEMAAVIAGSKLFIGNQSAPYSIAEALKVRTIQETRTDQPADCIFHRPGATFYKRGDLELPEI